jgi:hypothetical protein
MLVPVGVPSPQVANLAAPSGVGHAMPPAAAAVIIAVRSAIAARDFAALRRQLGDEGEFRIAEGLSAQRADLAITAWQQSPAVLAEVDRALSTGSCEVDPPERAR